MRMLLALLVAAAAACAIARPPPAAVPVETQEDKISEQAEENGINPHMITANDYYASLFVPKIILPGFFDTDEYLQHSSEDNTDNKEALIKYNQVQRQLDFIGPIGLNIERWIVHHRNNAEYAGPEVVEERAEYFVNPEEYVIDEIPAANAISPQLLYPENLQPNDVYSKRSSKEGSKVEPDNLKPVFAYTPFEKEYYAPIMPPHKAKTVQHDIKHYTYSEGFAKVLEAPRQIRQNPNLHKQKTLLGPEVGKLKSGYAQGEGGREERGEAERHGPIHSFEIAADPADSIYGVALIAAVGTALTMVIVGFIFGWYTLTRKAKAAADVDYPAYGVTGPTIDLSADRKLAHSAHMYHYQHQKQQIIAMERNGLEQRNGSISDPESEEENEEGDYTVYECPGLATTGDMEVKNPMFSEEPTPATPGKTEVVKAQPKE